LVVIARRLSVQTSQPLRDAAGDSAAGIKAAILGHLDEFLKGRELEDDVTVLVVQRETT